jgi:hypothetical protein
MRISNDLPVPSMMVPSTGRKTGVPVAQVNNVQHHVSLQKTISAYTVVQEAHMLVTMALNISFELIQKAYSKESSYTEIIAKLATIDSYFNRLSPGKQMFLLSHLLMLLQDHLKKLLNYRKRLLTMI